MIYIFEFTDIAKTEVVTTIKIVKITRVVVVAEDTTIRVVKASKDILVSIVDLHVMEI